MPNDENKPLQTGEMTLLSPEESLALSYANEKDHAVSSPALPARVDLNTTKPMALDDIDVKYDGAHLHNVNCWTYLVKLDLDDMQLEVLKAIIARYTQSSKRLRDLVAYLDSYHQENIYNPDIHYGDFYTTLIGFIEDHLKEIKGNLSKDAYSNLIKKIYLNDNGILNRTFENIRDLVIEHKLTDPDIESQISQRLANNRKKYNRYAQTPAMAGSTIGRVQSLVSKNYKPQQGTSLPGFRNYPSSAAISQGEIIELRLGTQAQRDKGRERVSPLFEAFLRVQINPDYDPDEERGLPEIKDITHIYFNNLGRDGDSIERGIEKRLTAQLHQLEGQPDNILVITLPADKGMMSHAAVFMTRDSHSLENTITELMAIAMESKDCKTKIKDFHISANARRLIFDGHDEAIMKDLMSNSIEKLGLKDKATITSAERQALWFHFNKYELPNFILKTIKPAYFNFSCKDGIDRGGVSSVYYNLIYSIENGFPINRIDFERGLHAAPAYVKERGMNHHLDMIWNTVDRYIEANYDSIKKDPRQGWLLSWRDNYCPKGRVKELLLRRVSNGRQELDNIPSTTVALTLSKQILDQVQELVEKKVSGKRMLLETTSTVMEHVLGRERNEEKLKSISAKIVVNYPILQTLVGLIKSFIGAIFYIPTLGQTEELITAGLATARSGFFNKQRKTLQSGLNDLSDNLPKEQDDENNKEHKLD